MVDLLTREKQAGKSLEWNAPQGGLALWLQTRADSAQIAKVALTQGVHVLPEVHFQLHPKRGNAIRLGYANLNLLEIRQGMKILLNVIP